MWPGKSGWVLEGRGCVEEFRPVTQEEVLQLVEIAPGGVPTDEAGAGGAAGPERTQITRPVDDDRVARVEQTAGNEIQTLLGAGDDEDLIRSDTGPRRDRPPEQRLPFGGRQPEGGAGAASQHPVADLAKCLGREAFQRR